jgi:hypothetical protein
MKDLYKQLGVDESAGESDIRVAVGAAAGELRDAAEFILLDPARRAVYDRNRRVLATVGRLRSNLGLNLSRFWPRSRFADFTIDLNPVTGGEGRRIDPMTMAWALGVEPPARNGMRRGKRRRLLIGVVLALSCALGLALWRWRAGLW